MLRNRSRAVTSKQALMTDQSSQSPSTRNCTQPKPSFFASQGFTAFPHRALPEVEPLMSPTSILDNTKPFSPFRNPFWYDTNQPKSPNLFSETKPSWDQLDPKLKGIGVALIDDKPNCEPNTKDKNDSSSTPSSATVLSGSKLRVQIPPVLNSSLSPVDSPKSPADFGIKTRNSQISASGYAYSGVQTKDSPRPVVAGYLSKSELELSEDYTCVISHGPGPKITHIFDNCIVENYCSLSDKSTCDPTDFLSICYTCKKNLEQKNDIYIYRGEKAFCSCECRYREMMLDELEN